MPQEFEVVRCYKCSVFQVHQVKKANKWICKMCGEKQSLKKVFFVGSGADCRQNVQRLNMMQGEQSEQAVLDMESQNQVTDFVPNNSNYFTSVETGKATQEQVNGTKWEKYIENENETVEEAENEIPDSLKNCVVTTQMSRGKKRKRHPEKSSSSSRPWAAGNINSPQRKPTSDLYEDSALNTSCSRLSALCGLDNDPSTESNSLFTSGNLFSPAKNTANNAFPQDTRLMTHIDSPKQEENHSNRHHHQNPNSFVGRPQFNVKGLGTSEVVDSMTEVSSPFVQSMNRGDLAQTRSPLRPVHCGTVNGSKVKTETWGKWGKYAESNREEEELEDY